MDPKARKIPTVEEVSDIIARSLVAMAQQGHSRASCIASAAAAARPYEDLLTAKPASTSIN